MIVGRIPAETRIITLASRPDGRPVRDNFRMEEIPLPEIADGQILVRNVYMSVEPAMRRRMERSDKHYTTNFEIGGPLDGPSIGQIMASRHRSFGVGDYVRHRLGWRDYAVVDATAAARVDPGRAPLPAWLGILGQTGFTAYVGLRRIGGLRKGDVVFVSAAAGAVGSAAGQFARLLGAARVIGSAGGTEKARLLVDVFGYDVGIDYRANLFEKLAKCAPDGIDLYFDNVGGDHLVSALYALNGNGRVVLCGMISTMEGASHAPGIDHLIQAVFKRLTLRGFIIYDHEDLRLEFEAQVVGWLRSGELVSRETVVEGLDHAADAFIGVLSGANVGKMLVHLAEESTATF